MTANLLTSFAIVAVAVALSVAFISSIYAQNHSGTNYSGSSPNTNMSEFPTRTVPGNITNTTASGNITLTPSK